MCFRSFYPLALLLSLAVFVSACDGFESGTPPNQVEEEAGTTVSFTETDLAAVEDDSVASIGVTINNPSGEEVTAEVLYADAISATDPSDFNFTESDAVGENGYVAGSVTFPANAEDGATRSIELVIKDDEPGEEREEGIFVLQNVQNAEIGSRDRLSFTIGAITVFFTDFQDQSLSPMSAVSVASNENWGTSNAGNPPNGYYAVANGFGANEPSNDWLITPAFNFNQLEDETLSFLNAKGFNDSGRRGLQVKVSTDYGGSGDPTSATWTNVSDQVNFSGGDFNFVSSGSIDLSGSDFQGEKVYIAFQYRSTSPDNAAAWEVDNITLTSSTAPPEDGE